LDEDILEYDESIDEGDYESDESYDDSESAEFLPLPLPGFPSPFGGARRSSPRTGGNQNFFRPPVLGQFVTQPQLRGALDRVRTDVKTNATAIKSVDAKVAAAEVVNRRQTQELAKQRQINQKQQRAIAGVRNELKKTKDMSLMMLLLTQPKTSKELTADATIGGITVESGSKFLVQSGDSNPMLLPLLLMGGMDGGSDNSMLMVLALTGGL
jgi:hypothetical protein